MRYYGFGNYYLSSLQQGLQAHHVCVEMFNQYNAQSFAAAFKHLGNDSSTIRRWNALDDWAKNHKTIVLLNGGNSADLKELHEFLSSVEHDYPFSKFHEDEVSLCGALTSVGIILSPRIYDTAAIDREMRGQPWISVIRNGKPIVRPTDLTPFEEELIAKLNQYGLAK